MSHTHYEGMGVCGQCEDAELLARWESGPGRRPTPEEGKRWLEQAHTFPRVCGGCYHAMAEHSSEDGVGCLHVILDLSTPGIVLHREFCHCTQSGTSAADL